MKCALRNTCARKYLCCNYCKEKKCDDRCKDDHKDCKYFCNIPDDLTNPEETATPPRSQEAEITDR